MQIPIDVKEVLKAAGDIDEARKMPVSVTVFIDQSAPADLAQFAVDTFAPAEEHPNTRVDVVRFAELPASVPVGCDFCVLAAALSPSCGRMADMLRRAGMPVVVVTTLPQLASEIASASGYPFLKLDTVSPVDADPSALPTTADEGNREPYDLGSQGCEVMRRRLGAWVVDTFKDKRLAFALAFPFARKPLALEFVNATSLQNAGIGAVALIPGADMPLMTANQAKMLLQIAAAYGQAMGVQRAKELVGVVGGAFALRAAARQVAGVVPGLGWAVKGGIGYAGTQAMGRAGIVYFEQVTGGEPVSHAVEAAKAEAERAADMFAQGSNPIEGGRRVISGYTDRARAGFNDKFGNVAPALRAAVPAVRQAAPVVKDAVSTAVPAVADAVRSIAEASGIDPKDLAKQTVSALLKSRKG